MEFIKALQRIKQIRAYHIEYVFILHTDLDNLKIKIILTFGVFFLLK